MIDAGRLPSSGKSELLGNTCSHAIRIANFLPTLLLRILGWRGLIRIYAHDLHAAILTMTV